MSRKILTNLRNVLKPFVGCSIDVDANVGRKRVVPYEGVLESVYPNIFVVRVGANDEEEERRLSFSYVDLFTGNVVVSLHKDGHIYNLAPKAN